MSKKDLKFNAEGKCPICGSDMINYDSSEIDGNCMWYPCECENCGTMWQEVYTLTFDTVDNVRDVNGKTIYDSFEEEYNK